MLNADGIILSNCKNIQPFPSKKPSHDRIK